MVSSLRAAALFLFFVILPMASDALKCSKYETKAVIFQGNYAINDIALIDKKSIDCKYSCVSWIQVVHAKKEIIYRNGCSETLYDPNNYCRADMQKTFNSLYQNTYHMEIPVECTPTCTFAACNSKDYCNDYQDMDGAFGWSYNDERAKHCRGFPAIHYNYKEPIGPPTTTTPKPTEIPGTLSPGSTGDSSSRSDAKSGLSGAPTSSAQGWSSMMKMPFIYGGMTFLLMMATVFGLN